MIDPRSELLEDSDFDTILSRDIDFSGIIIFEKPFLIRGNVSGTIHGTGLLVIDTGATVEAIIDAPHVIIRGTVQGNIHASEKIEISRTGKLAGDILTMEIAFESGCLFNGRCTMSQQMLLENKALGEIK
ncbi:hypothetical protein FACS1894172_16610 [Spirochaetia bacterium]|nr:hypothetical protein FACS1894164_00830 [Spirochaetia bacterium]GHU35195.1 hypothetical protein FACS1894172_16610 [Spirochaetia bacterium]